jgi:hypothetical protein
VSVTNVWEETIVFGIMGCYWTGWCIDKAGGSGFESRPGHRLSWFRFLVVFFSPSRQVTGKSQLGQERFLQILLQFITRYVILLFGAIGLLENSRNIPLKYKSEYIVACLGTETRSSDCWLVLFQSSPVVTTRNYYTSKIAVIITHKVFNSFFL